MKNIINIHNNDENEFLKPNYSFQDIKSNKLT